MPDRPAVEYSRKPEPSWRVGFDAPSIAVAQPDERDWARWWVGGGVLATAMVGSGGYVGYRMQMSEAGLADVIPLENYLKKAPHPFLKEPALTRPVEPPIQVTRFAARGGLFGLGLDL